MKRAALRTQVLLPETPDLFSWFVRTLSESVPCFFAAEHVPATAHVRFDELEAEASTLAVRTARRTSTITRLYGN